MTLPGGAAIDKMRPLLNAVTPSHANISIGKCPALEMSIGFTWTIPHNCICRDASGQPTTNCKDDNGHYQCAQIGFELLYHDGSAMVGVAIVGFSFSMLSSDLGFMSDLNIAQEPLP